MPTNIEPNPELTDAENPELTEDFFRAAKPAKDVLPENVLAGVTRTRGSQKAPTKQPMSIRLSPEVVAYFRATGKGWQSRMDDVLLEYVKSRSQLTT